MNGTAGYDTEGPAPEETASRISTRWGWAQRRLIKVQSQHTEQPQPESGTATAWPEPLAPGAPSTEATPLRLKLRLWQEVAQEFPRIQVDPSILRGEPVIAGTRIPVYLLVSLVAEGRSYSEITRSLDGEIAPEDIIEALRFAAMLAR